MSNVLEYRWLILEGCFDLFFPALTDPAAFQECPWNLIIILRRVYENDDLASPRRMLCRTFPRRLFHSSDSGSFTRLCQGETLAPKETGPRETVKKGLEAQ